MTCRTGCPTPGAHETWGECMRDANLRIAYCQSAAGRDYTSQRKWDAELDAYDAAVDQGINPEGTTWDKINLAVRASEEQGVAYGTPAWEKHVQNKLLEAA